jgi:hypothetical protein
MKGKSMTYSKDESLQASSRTSQEDQDLTRLRELLLSGGGGTKPANVELSTSDFSSTTITSQNLILGTHIPTNY